MMEKLSKTAKRLDTLFKILFWFLVAAAGIIILFSLLKIVLTPEDMSKYAVSEQLILGNIMLTVSEEAIPIIGEMWWIYVLPYLTYGCDFRRCNYLGNTHCPKHTKAHDIRLAVYRERQRGLEKARLAYALWWSCGHGVQCDKRYAIL